MRRITVPARRRQVTLAESHVLRLVIGKEYKARRLVIGKEYKALLPGGKKQPLLSIR
jgi:hypothetical protein